MLNNPEDWVRREIVIALAGDACVVPVLVGARARLSPADLPEDVRKLAFLQGPHLARAFDAEEIAKLVDLLIRDVPALIIALARTRR